MDKITVSTITYFWRLHLAPAPNHYVWASDMVRAFNAVRAAEGLPPWDARRFTPAAYLAAEAARFGEYGQRRCPPAVWTRSVYGATEQPGEGRIVRAWWGVRFKACEPDT